MPADFEISSGRHVIKPVRPEQLAPTVENLMDR